LIRDVAMLEAVKTGMSGTKATETVVFQSSNK
jgi:hypothetical protein